MESTGVREVSSLWIDESGDCGFHFDRGSTQFFIVVALFTDEKNVCESGFKDLMRTLDAPEKFEFKFSHCKKEWKNECMGLIAHLPIMYKALVVDKRDVMTPELRSPHTLYCECIRRILYDNDPALMRATLCIDEATAKIHHRAFNSILRRTVSKNVVAAIKQYRSQSEIMIQVADMIAGSIFRKFEKGDDSYYQKICTKEKILVKF